MLSVLIFICIAFRYWTNEDQGYTVKPPPANDTGLASTAWRLYDLANDELEESDVAAAHPEVVKAMVDRVAYLGDVLHGYKSPQLNIPAVGPIGKKADPGPDNNYTWAPFQK